MKIKIIALFMLLLPFAINGQTIDDAKEAYNKGARVYTTDKDSALIYFEQSLSACEIVGTAGDSLRMKIETYLPGIYFDIANEAYREKRYDEALIKGQKALEIADKYHDDRNKERSTKLLIASNFVQGNNSFRANDLANATKYYEITVKLDPKYSKAWYNMAQAYMKMGDADKMEAAMAKTIALSKEENDTITIEKANKQCRDFYYKQGVNAASKNEDATAISKLDKALSYDVKFGDAYYLQASIYNKQAKSKEVLEVCNTALKYETSPEGSVKFYFQMGYAYVALKQNGEACATFKKVVESKDKSLAPKAADILKKNPMLCEAGK